MSTAEELRNIVGRKWKYREALLLYKKDLEEEKNEAKIYRFFGLTHIFKSPKSWRLLETTFLLSAFCLISNLV